MEKLTTTDTPRKSSFKWKTLTLALCSALSLSMISCWNTTSKDVLKQQKKVESLSFQISHYIDARKQLVEDYNKLLSILNLSIKQLKLVIKLIIKTSFFNLKRYKYLNIIMVI